MSFVSLRFLIFFPLAALVFWIVPKRARPVWLLLASYYFYMCWQPVYALLMAGCTLAAYAGGLLVGRAGTPGGRRLWAAVSVTACLAVLGVFKYAGFLADTLFYAHLAPARTFSLVVPVGISFYTFQAVGYVIDVYRGTIRPEKNILRFALFVSFFPQLVAGPIERAGDLMPQLRCESRFSWEKTRRGLLRMLWGFFLKLVIADRVAVAVNEVYGHIGQYAGLSVWAAVGLFAVQIYCDFGGYSQIAVGAAEVMGIELMQNFDRPYFSHTIQEYWSRWHISLSRWFADYVFYPLATNKRLRRFSKRFGRGAASALPQCAALLVTFLLSGLWHGAAWTFVVWGGLHGVYQIVGQLTRKGRERLWDRLGVNRRGALYRLWQIVFVFTLCALADVFFRAASFADAAALFGAMLRPGALSGLGLTGAEWIAAGASAAVLFVYDLAAGRGDPWRRLERRSALLRWPVYILLLLAVVILGCYGPGYSAASFIYFQF